MTDEWEKRFSNLARRTLPPEISWLMAQALEVPGLISLAAGFVDQDSLPNTSALQCLTGLLDNKVTGRAALQYGTTQGDMELRRLLVQRLQTEGVFHSGGSIDESHILITSGSQQLLYLAAEALLDEGDIVLVEAPTYFVVLGAFKTRGVRTIGIDIDEGGIIPERVEECLSELERRGEIGRVKMLYLMSYSTNPTGITLAEERRKQIPDIIKRYRDRGIRILLLEDAAYRRLCYDGPIPPPIKTYDIGNNMILYTESFSKSLSPGLRLGFGAGPKSLIDKMVDIKGNHDFGSSNLGQQILKSFIGTKVYGEHVKMLHRIYARKRDIALELFENILPAEVKWIRPSGGLYIWITLPEGWDTGPKSDLFKRAMEEKVLYVPGCLCYSSDRPESVLSSSLRISYGMIDETHLREGCERLGRALAGSAPSVI